MLLLIAIILIAPLLIGTRTAGLRQVEDRNEKKVSNREAPEASAEPFWGDKALTFGVGTVQQDPAHAVGPL